MKISNYLTAFKLFSVGVLVGCILVMVWFKLLVPIEDENQSYKLNKEIELLKDDSKEKLIEYMKGKWLSSRGDLQIDLKSCDKYGTIVSIDKTIENSPVIKQFKIVSIDSVDGFLGIIRLNVCEIKNNSCDINNPIKLQVNKIFGIENTIAISYDKNVTFCINSELCTRAFKRSQE